MKQNLREKNSIKANIFICLVLTLN